jgi:hypothetical protein
VHALPDETTEPIAPEYEPPAVEDLDASEGPALTAAGISPPK